MAETAIFIVMMGLISQVVVPVLLFALLESTEILLETDGFQGKP